MSNEKKINLVFLSHLYSSPSPISRLTAAADLCQVAINSLSSMLSGVLPGGLKGTNTTLLASLHERGGKKSITMIVISASNILIVSAKFVHSVKI